MVYYFGSIGSKNNKYFLLSKKENIQDLLH